MKAVRTYVGWILVLVAVGTGCTGHSKAPSNTVGIDLVHGHVWSNLTETLSGSGFVPVLLDQAIDAKSLRFVRVLFITGTTKTFSETEIKDITQFVKQGGGLLCADEAWSWVFNINGNKPIDTFPLNILGQEMNFFIRADSVGSPTYFDTGIMAGIDHVVQTDWRPSQVELRSKDRQAIIRDGEQRIMGGSVSFGRGRIVLYGHGMLLKENPEILENTLSYLAGTL